MHPAPEVPARVAEDVELPPTVKAIMKAASGGTWTLYATFSRGTTAKGTLLENVALKAWRGNERIVGVWERGPIQVPLKLSWSFWKAWAWQVVAGAIPVELHREIGSTEMKAMVTT